MTALVARIDVPTADLEAIMSAAIRDLSTLRGGAQLRADLLAATGADRVESLGASLIEQNGLYGVFDSESLVGIAAVSASRPVTMYGIYVYQQYRRSKLATALLRKLGEAEFCPIDAWVLPGDRATKSLYESVGWKARRLTMSGE
jgi:GNAT superfamily N-acetyltransferase